MWTREEFLARCRAVDFEPARDAILAEADGVVAGYTAMFAVGALVFVHPEYERRGIGTALLTWTEERERERGRDVHRQRVAAANRAAAELLHAAGYARVRTVLQFELGLSRPPVAADPPAGVTLRPIDPASDVRALHAADSVAFADNADAFEESFENFEAEHLAVDSLDLAASAVARRGETIAGFIVCQRRPGGIGYIDLLAVLPGERGHGLGAALLVHALGAFARDGLREARLETASDNPAAIRLYKRAGMMRGPGADVWEKPVASRAGAESAERLGQP